MRKNSKNDFIFNKNDSLLHQCIETLQSLSSHPDNYFKGLSNTSVLLPDNILLFKRTERFRGGDIGASHGRYVLIIALIGEGTVIVDDKTFRLHAQEAILVHPYQLHRYVDMCEQNRKWMFISFEHMSSDLLNCLRDQVLPNNEIELMMIKQILLSYYEQKSTGITLLLANLLNALFEKLQLLKPLKQKKDHEPDNDILKKVVAYVSNHLNESLQVQKIAEEMQLSESYLRAKFKKISGMSLGNYVRHTRLHRAAVYLSVSGYSISKIAEKTGFDSLFSFSRAFSAKYKASPSEYRKKEKQS